MARRWTLILALIFAEESAPKSASSACHSSPKKIPLLSVAEGYGMAVLELSVITGKLVQVGLDRGFRALGRFVFDINLNLVILFEGRA